MKTNTLLIRTPEGIVFALPLAGPVTRFLAWAVDGAVVFAASYVLSLLLGLLSWIGPDVIQAVLVLFFFVLHFYFLIFSAEPW